jgi:signal transduction histidine kinase/CheY-like chemotaxis protein
MMRAAHAASCSLILDNAHFTAINYWERLAYDPSTTLRFADVAARWHPDDRERVVRAIRAYLAGETREYEVICRMIGGDGTSRWGLARGVAVRDATGRAIRFTGSTVDVTERIEMEEALRTAKEVAEAGNRAKDAFMANVSHEIRTPMNAILGMSELLLDTTLNADQQQLLRTVKSAAGSLLAVINDLLDFSKIEAGKLELDHGDFFLRALFGDTMRALAVRAHRKGLELVCNVHPDVPDALRGDGGRLRQVLVNLVGNAIKFTSRGEVVVDVESVDGTPEAEPVTLRFIVRDTGIGISKEKQTLIFDAFEQADTSTTRKYGGTGLGLTIAARLVFMMGGEITVDSELDHGSTFSFTAAFGRNREASLPEPSASSTLLWGLRVLVVDDNAANRQILDAWLRDWKMDPTAVGDGVAAMDALWHGVSTGRPYALALLDSRMPDIDGLALASKIRERSELAATRLVLLTSGERPGEFERSRELRISAHLLKPVPQEELLETIHQTVSRGADAATDAIAGARPVLELHDSEALPSPLRVLVAEDHPANAQLLRRLLLKWGHAVRVAGNGREALDLAQSGRFDVVLLDLHMPELDGLELVKLLRESERASGAHLPVIALTARSRATDRASCLAAGMDDFMTKPIQAGTLMAALARVSQQGTLPPDPGLLDARALLAATGGDPSILAEFGEGLRLRLPVDLALVTKTLNADDAAGVREAAHALSGLLTAFSSVAGGLATDLEEHAAHGHLAEARVLLRRIEQIAPQVLAAVAHATIESLRRDAGQGNGEKP